MAGWQEEGHVLGRVPLVGQREPNPEVLQLWSRISQDIGERANSHIHASYTCLQSDLQ